MITSSTIYGKNIQEIEGKNKKSFYASPQHINEHFGS